MRMLDVIDDAVFILSIYSEILYGKFYDVTIPIEVITDIHSLVDTFNSKLVTEKRLRIEISALKEAIKENNIKYQCVPTKL